MKMLQLETKDNSADTITDKQYKILEPFSNKSIKELQKQNNNLLAFPALIDHPSEDESLLFKTENTNSEKKIYTNNMMGVLKVFNKEHGTLNIEIRSRFDNNENQLFLMYMLSQAFDGYFLNWKVDAKIDIWDMLLILVFPYYLVRAFRQGLYKQYHLIKYNNPNFKGKIDITEFIRNNIPFQGKINYQASEITYDNHILHLIRHTLFLIKNEKSWLFTTINNIEFQRAYNAIIEVTPSWRIQEVDKIIRLVQTPIKHPLFTEYESLRKICLNILSRMGFSIYNNYSESEIEGVVFDGAWLWEKYLSTILKQLDFKHHQYKKNGDGIKVFDNKRYKLYPDFLNVNRKVVLDAKYKKPGQSSEDIHQVLSYMYLTDAEYGGLIYPVSCDDKRDRVGIPSLLYYKKATWLDLFFIIPDSTSNNTKDYSKQIKNNEDAFLSCLNNITT